MPGELQRTWKVNSYFKLLGAHICVYWQNKIIKESKQNHWTIVTAPTRWKHKNAHTHTCIRKHIHTYIITYIHTRIKRNLWCASLRVSFLATGSIIIGAGRQTNIHLRIPLPFCCCNLFVCSCAPLTNSLPACECWCFLQQQQMEPQ